MTRALGSIAIAWLVALTTLALTVPSTASAQGGFYVGGGLGPAVRIHDWPTQFRLEQEVGYYFEGRPEGFFIGLTPSESFSEHNWVLTIAPRFGYVFNLYRAGGIAFQLGPAGTIPGLAVAGCYGDLDCEVDAYFHFSVSLLLRLLIADERVAIYLRPLELEFAFGDEMNRVIGDFWEDHAIRYVLAGGVQFPL